MIAPKIEGLAALEKKLASLEPNLRKKTARKALRAALNPVRAEVRRLTPVKTGNARRLVSLKVLNAKGRFPMAGFVGWYFGKRHRRKGDDPFYIRWVEFGKDQKHRQRRLSPLRRAGDATLTPNGIAVRILSKDLKAGVEREAAR